MALCRDCHNPVDSCECEEFSPSALPTQPKWAPTRVGAPVDLARLLDEVQADRRERLEEFLQRIRTMGCSVEHPTGRADNYVNVRPPTGIDEYRLCTITRSTGRLHFPNSSASHARRLSLSDRFDTFEDDEAAINLDEDADLDAAVRVAKAILDARRGTG